MLNKQIYIFLKLFDIYSKFKLTGNFNNIRLVYCTNEHAIQYLSNYTQTLNKYLYESESVSFKPNMSPMPCIDDIDIASLYKTNGMEFDTSDIPNMLNLYSPLEDEFVTPNPQQSNITSELVKHDKAENKYYNSPVITGTSTNINIEEWDSLICYEPTKTLNPSFNDQASDTQVEMTDVYLESEGRYQQNIDLNSREIVVDSNIFQPSLQCIPDSQIVLEQIYYEGHDNISGVINTKGCGSNTNEVRKDEELMNPNVYTHVNDTEDKNIPEVKTFENVKSNLLGSNTANDPNAMNEFQNIHTKSLCAGDRNFVSYTCTESQYVKRNVLKTKRLFRPLLHYENTNSVELNKLPIKKTYYIHILKSSYNRNAVYNLKRAFGFRIYKLKECGNAERKCIQIDYSISNIPRFLIFEGNQFLKNMRVKTRIECQLRSFNYTLHMTIVTPINEKIYIMNILPDLIFTNQLNFWRYRYSRNIVRWQYTAVNHCSKIRRENYGSNIKADRPEIRSLHLKIKDFLSGSLNILKFDERLDIIFVAIVKKLSEFKAHIENIANLKTSLENFKKASIAIFNFRKKFVEGGRIKAPLRQLNSSEHEILSVYNKIYFDFGSLSLSIINAYNLFLRDEDEDILE